VQLGVLQRTDDATLVVIVADGTGGLVALADEEHQDEAAVYVSGDPAIGVLLEPYGPGARVMPLQEYRAPAVAV
jgi:hypothetical protein